MNAHPAQPESSMPSDAESLSPGDFDVEGLSGSWSHLRPFLTPALAVFIAVALAWDARLVWTMMYPDETLPECGACRVERGESCCSQSASQSGSRSRHEPEFDLANATVPAKEIRAGGPTKDGIPALTAPKLVNAQEATLEGDDRVAGVIVGDAARAYPLAILNYHEIVNDRIGDLPVAVTYCPLCDSVVAFDRRTPLGEREFGVSGLLYNSNVLMYDRGGTPESLWSQLATNGISGPGANVALAAVPVELTTWREWLATHPNTQVLSTETGHQRDYTRNPYEQYFSKPGLMFPAKPRDNRLPNKERVLGVWTSDAARCYPESSFGPNRTRVEDTAGDKKIVIAFNPETKSLRVESADDGVQWMYSLWFAWYAFRPATTVFE